ncbi:MAG: hypothetical protein H6907_09255 [Hyphomicrobiales bacterium]|nr:hypothetical protein [Hyphomicrobiales bacterium]
MTRFAIFLLALALLPAGARAGTPIQEAVALFETMVRLEKAYDPALADLYADDARIEYVSVYPDGTRREIKMTGAELKAILRKMGPMAKALKSTARYADVRYGIEGRNLMGIRGLRVSPAKGTSDPFRMTVGLTGDGTWKILSEYGEARP